MSKPAILGGTPVTTPSAWPRWPQWDACEERALQRVLASGRWQAGPEVGAFEEEFARYQGSAHAICVTNGTASLELALLALELRPGDEVVVPSYTFAASALAVLRVGLRPVLVDVDEETLAIDPDQVERALSESTRAVMPVHVGGHPVDMDALGRLAREHALAVVEDAAHAHGAEWRGTRIGGTSTCASFSFQTGKNMTSGDGGCLTTSDAEVAGRLRSLRDFGRGPSGALERVGGNERMTEFQAAVLRCQLARLDDHIAVREYNVEQLAAWLEPVPGVRVARADPRVTRHPHYQVVIHVDPERFGVPKSMLLAALAAEGVPIEGGYEPLHRMPLFRREAAAGRLRSLACPVSERAADYGVLWLSFRMALASREQLQSVPEAFERIHAYGSEVAMAGERR